MDSRNALALVFSRNDFYKRLHYLALGAFGLSLIVIAILAGMLIYLWKVPVQPTYFSTDTVGRLIQIVPPNQPNMTLDDVMAWTVEAVQDTYSYDYNNYHAQLQNAEKYFTRQGWQSYLRALTASNNLVGVQQRKMVLQATVVEKPTVKAQGILGGAFAWKMEMPMLITYMVPPYDEQSKYSNALQVSVVVQRQPGLQGYKGLGIVQIVSYIVGGEVEPVREISSTSSQ